MKAEGHLGRCYLKGRACDAGRSSSGPRHRTNHPIIIQRGPCEAQEGGMVWTKRVGWPHGASLLSHLYQYCVSCPCNRRGIVGEASRVREGSYRVLSKFTANKRVDRRPVREAWSPPFLRNIQAL